MLNIIQIPALTDNYIHLLHEPESNEVVVIDPPEGESVLKYLNERQLPLNWILNTHHHSDHIGGNAKLQAETECRTACSIYDFRRILGANRVLIEGEEVKIGNTALTVLETPGHTLGHLCFWAEQENLLFSGDTLFGMGCGRLFEGSAEQLFESLKKLSELPPETLCYCAHEYTEQNARFALSIEPDNVALQQRLQAIQERRRQQQSTVPFSLAEELATNPFLRTDQKAIREKLGMLEASELEVFTQLRRMKDVF